MPLAAGFAPDGVPIYYQIYGNDQAPPVLFLHGFGGYFDEIRYDWIIDFFSDYKLIGVDVRGHGRSGKPDQPDDYGLALLDDITRLLDHLELPTVHFIGVSMGGIVGLKYASFYPDRIQSLTLVGQGLVPAESFQDWVAMGRAVVESAHRSAEEQQNLHMYSGFLSGYPPLQVTDAEAGALAVPVLIVIGENDERLPLARILKNLYPATNLIIAPGYDHFDIMAQGSPFYLVIKGFLEQNRN